MYAELSKKIGIVIKVSQNLMSILLRLITAYKMQIIIIRRAKVFFTGQNKTDKA